MNTMNSLDFHAMNAALGNLFDNVDVMENRIPRLLLVDDEPRLLNSLCELLKDFDYELHAAASGKDAIGYLKRMPFDLALLDLRLPDLSGHQIMDFILEHKLDTNVIILSGDRGINAAVGAIKRGAYSYLRKPYATEELLKTIENALQKRRLEAANRDMMWRLECSEKLYRYLVDSSPDIIYTLNPSGEFTFVNDRAQQLLGYQRNELIGRHFSTLIHEDDLERAHYVFNERRVGDRASRNVELRLKCAPAYDNRVISTMNTFMTISFNSMGLYSVDHNLKPKEYFGTYGVARDITARKRAEEQLSYQAYHDVLTSLPNRVLFTDRLELALIQAKRNCSQLAVMFMDLDRFKLVNDTLGHMKGDDLLQQVAARLKGCLRRGDTLARLGGDEFTVLLPGLSSRQDAALVASHFIQVLQEPFDLSGNEVYISASIGIAVYPEHGNSVDELISRADIAMYQVKAVGKNGQSYYDNSMLDASYQKMSLEKNLRKAIENNELEMHYQPQIDVATGRIIAVEALMRWNHPERGLLAAGDFLPFVEESGLMIAISDWMIHSICMDLVEWNATGNSSIRLSFNVSPHYLDRGDFYRKLQDALIRFQIPPSQIEVEITENICIRNPQYAIEQLNKLSALGISVAIDDFGTGYSSLAYLHRFPIHTIKIDKSFIKEISEETGNYPVVLAIISIARGLGLKVIAEGVETETQSRYLENAGCRIMQGFLFYQPLSRAHVLKLLRAQTAMYA